MWGRVRNTVRENRHAAQVSAADLENERLTEQASLAQYYFQLRGQDALQDLFNKTIEADEVSLDLTRTLVETGIDSEESCGRRRKSPSKMPKKPPPGSLPTGPSMNMRSLR